jgi:hypothetical protein
MTIIPSCDIKAGDTIEYDGKTYIADKHVTRGADLKGTDYTHIMFDNKGCFAMREIVN